MALPWSWASAATTLWRQRCSSALPLSQFSGPGLPGLTLRRGQVLLRAALELARRLRQQRQPARRLGITALALSRIRRRLREQAGLSL